MISIPFWSDLNCNNCPSLNVCIDKFQSHFGLIWTVFSRIHFYALFLYFNPILVWFELGISELKSIFVCCISIPFWSDLNWRRQSNADHGCVDFNPILVWFEQISLREFQPKRLRRISIPFWSDLNSATFPWVFSHFQQNFNPILVWFELTTKTASITTEITFQSHFGLIWTFHLLHFDSSPCKFQSHFGLIWT